MKVLKDGTTILEPGEGHNIKNSIFINEVKEKSVAPRDYAADKGFICVNDKMEYNAYHEYFVVSGKDEKWKKENGEEGVHPFIEIIGDLKFQKGPIKEVGVNGITERDLLEIIKHRLSSFQASPFKSEYNHQALKAVQDAIDALDARTKDRENRGVEGTNEK